MERRLSDARAERLRTQPTGYRGQMFELLMRSGIGYEAVTAHRTNVWVAEAVATLTGREPAKPTVTAAMRAVRTHFLEADPDWQMSFELRTMLMLHRSLPDPANLETVEAWLGEAVDGFLRFEAKFWTLPSEDPNAPHRPYLRKEFHRRWVYSILAAVLTGGQLLILSPPRHGKTELLQHLCVWLICRNPNIRIIWVGPNGQTAQDTVGAIREMLENNTSLITEVCGPAGSFAPVLRSGSKWTDARFTVATRTILGMKAPTVTAQGKDAKLLSKDADLIVGDDIEDYDSTETPGARESGRTWFYTQLETRKQVRTAWFLIGSRQHPDDLYGYLIDDPTWQSIITAAHDQNCRRDPEEILAHVDCMLFPEVNPYVWLYTKWKGALARGQEHLYEMVYLNNPQPEGMIQWTRELAMRAANVGRGLGLQGIKLTAGSEFHLIAGLDRPSSGSVRVAGSDIGAMSDSELARWRSQTLGFVFQAYNLIPVLTALENVELPLLLAPVSAGERKKRAQIALRVVGLEDRMHHRPAQLSGGQEQRVGIARAIVHDPAIIVADEPTGELDRQSADEVLGLLDKLNSEFNKTILMVTHDPAAAERASIRRRLDKGKLT